MYIEKVKHFTLVEAQKTLPLVRQIVRDIIATGARIKLQRQYHPNDINTNSVIPQLEKELIGFLKELNEIGCYYKNWNFAIGLVDFPAVIAGREAFFCWRSDEKEIKYYHPIKEGYSARTLIPEKYFEE